MTDEIKAVEPKWPHIEDAPTPYVTGNQVLPEKLRESLNRYAKYGIPTGGFLRAVLANDCMDAVMRADNSNVNRLRAICGYIYNCLPGHCWGSHAVVEKHIRKWRPISSAWFEGNPSDES